MIEYAKKCKCCGKEFVAGSNLKLYCNVKCRRILTKKRLIEKRDPAEVFN